MSKVGPRRRGVSTVERRCAMGVRCRHRSTASHSFR
nr:MAG TPA: hypothetical protein [Caudoviricetes sp.]